MATATCIAASEPVTTAPEWHPAGQNLRELALPLRLMLSTGTSVAIATVVSARGPVLRPPGTVLVTSKSGQTIGFNPAGPLDRAIRDLTAEVLATGHHRLASLEIDADAASYIGLSGAASMPTRLLNSCNPVSHAITR
jgi:XdhC and CoxI family